MLYNNVNILYKDEIYSIMMDLNIYMKLFTKYLCK